MACPARHRRPSHDVASYGQTAGGRLLQGVGCVRCAARQLPSASSRWISCVAHGCAEVPTNRQNVSKHLSAWPPLSKASGRNSSPRSSTAAACFSCFSAAAVEAAFPGIASGETTVMSRAIVWPTRNAVMSGRLADASPYVYRRGSRTKWQPADAIERAMTSHVASCRLLQVSPRTWLHRKRCVEER